MTHRVTHFTGAGGSARGRGIATQDYSTRAEAILSIVDSAEDNHWTFEFEDSDHGVFAEAGEPVMQFKIEELTE